MIQVPPEFLAWRRKTGADRCDETWDGVLHMVPNPNREHQDLEWALEAWLRRRWVPRSGGKVYHQINVARPIEEGGDWRRDYRVPDLVLLTPERFAIDRNEYFAGGPEAVVEIRSRGDETDEKIPFYAAVGVRELWVIDRDTREVEVHTLSGQEPRQAEPDADGWLQSELGVELRAERDGRLALRLRGVMSSLGHVP